MRPDGFRWYYIYRDGRPKFAVDLNSLNPYSITKFISKNNKFKIYALKLYIVFLKISNLGSKDLKPIGGLSNELIDSIYKIIKCNNKSLIDKPSLSIYFGTPCIFTTNILQINYNITDRYSKKQDTYFVKIPVTETAISTVANEIMTLQRLSSDLEFRKFLPEIVISDKVDDKPICVMKDLGNYQSISNWKPELTYFFNRLIKKTGEFYTWQESPVYKEFENYINVLNKLGKIGDVQLLNELAIRLNQKWSNTEILFSTSHTDFTPWNVIETADGTKIIDWELANVNVAGYDILNFFILPSCTIKDNSDVILNWIIDPFLYTLFQDVCKGINMTISENYFKNLVLTYLVYTFALHHTNESLYQKKFNVTREWPTTITNLRIICQKMNTQKD